MAEFNERLRQLREAAGQTQEGLARAADLSVSTITKLERGGMDPSWSTVLRLAEALSVSITAFLPAVDATPTPPPAKARRPRGRKGE
jgi:transcriptional regulator with XRE-family HTH domain